MEHLRGRIEKVLVEFGGKGVLFILDNVHLEEEFAVDVFYAWQELAHLQGARLLLVGREVRRRAGSVLEEAPLTPLVLRAGADDVRGVYNRLARREVSSDQEPPKPPQEVLRSWVRTFGGDPDRLDHSVDLMAFSAAAQNRMQYLCRGDWELSVHNARDEIRKHYLAPLGNDEIDNVLRLAALPEDCFLPSEALAAPYVSFDTCVKKGLVFETEYGRDKYVRYSLVHSSLGKLLLSAATGPIDRTMECCTVARLSPVAGFVIARRSAENAEKELARSVLRAIAENPDWLKDVSSVQHLPSNVEEARRLGVDLLAVADTVPATISNHLLKCALGSPLHHLVTFLTYARSEASGLSKLHAALVADLVRHPEELAKRARETALGDLVTFLTYARSEASGLSKLHAALVTDLVRHPEELAKRARKTDLHFLVTFLTYARSEASGLSKLHAALVADLVRHPEELAKRARETALGDLVTFLTYARSEASGLSKLHAALVADLVRHPEELAKRARETALGDLVTFLTYARSEASGLSKLHAALVADLVRHPEELAKRARETALGDLVTFLTYARSEASGLSKLHAALVADLVRHPEELAKRALKTPLEHLVAFLTYARSEASGFPAKDSNFAHNVCFLIDVAAWDRQRMVEKPQQPSFAVNVAKLFAQVGRPELVTAPARTLVYAADPKAWHAPGIGLHHLSQYDSVLRWGGAGSTCPVPRPNRRATVAGEELFPGTARRPRWFVVGVGHQLAPGNAFEVHHRQPSNPAGSRSCNRRAPRLRCLGSNNFNDGQRCNPRGNTDLPQRQMAG